MAEHDTSLVFKRADFTSSALLGLLRIHHATATDPSTNILGQKTYALDLDDLQKPDIQLWVIFSTSGGLLGCGALKSIILRNAELVGEIKCMHTVSRSRGQGIGARMLTKLVDEAEKLGIKKVYLETGSSQGFAAARSFYAGNDFRQCGPFGGYEEQENSFFMCRKINSS